MTIPANTAMDYADAKAALKAMAAGVTKLMDGINKLNSLLDPPTSKLPVDPKDPRNFYPLGTKSHKLTERGAEVIYRLFDLGFTPHAAGKAMGISFIAAQGRQAKWTAAGGFSRKPAVLED